MKTKLVFLNLIFCSLLNAQNIFNFNDVYANVNPTGIHLNGLDSGKLTISKFKNYPLIYTSALWFGGMNSLNDSLYVAAETYRQKGYDFKPGPIDLITKNYDSVASDFYNRVWKINKKTIDEFKLNWNKIGYVIPKEIVEWPAHGIGNFSYNLAPFVDFDNNGKYEPEKGDYPKIKGDFMFWWVFNDLGKHTETNSKNIGVEVHGSCYAYLNLKLKESDPDYIINRSLFFNFKIINRSDINYKDFYIGVFNDFDIGNYTDDNLAIDTANNLVLGVNGDNFENGFGQNPPIVTCQFLNKKMNSNKYFINNNGTINGHPINKYHYYYYLKGRDKLNFIDTTRFKIKSCESGLNINNDVRLLSSSKVDNFLKDSIFNFDIVYSIYYDPNKDFLKDDCNQVTEGAIKFKKWYDKDSFPSKSYWGLNSNYNLNNGNQISVFPNPFYNKVQVIFNNFNLNEIAKIEIVDALGRVVYNFNTNVPENYLALEMLPNGIYYIKVQTSNYNVALKLIKQ